MARLKRRVDGRTLTLQPRTRVGRALSNELQLDNPRSSGEHARFAYSGGAWTLRDLGSRNGTWRQGERLPAGADCPLTVGDHIGFGDAEDVWVFDDDAPPVALARPLSGGASRHAEHGLIALPDSDAPVVVISARPDGSWWIEGATGGRVAKDRELFSVGEGAWQLVLPAQLGMTRSATASHSAVRVEFLHSLDEEHVQLFAHHGASRLDLGARVHNYVLLLLARARLADAGSPESERGWVYTDALLSDLRVDRLRLNLQVFRARKVFAKAGLAEHAELIQRRADSDQLRLGVADVTVKRAGS